MQRLTVREALAIERAAGMTIVELIGGAPVCGTCRGRPPRGFACLRCGQRADEHTEVCR
jgi:tRNA(Ile2) C34 agmatinyltransferase TiaS